MCRSMDLVLLVTAVLTVNQMLTINYIEAIPTDDKTRHSFEIYDLPNSEDVMVDTIKQPLTAYQDYIITSSKEFYLPETLVTTTTTTTTTTSKKVPNEEHDTHSDQDDVSHEMNFDNENSEDEEIEEEQEDMDDHETSTSASNVQTTIVLDPKTSELINDLIMTKELEELDNSSQVNDADELFSNKQAKMLAQSYNSAEIQLLPGYIENTIQSEQLIMKNETIDNGLTNSGDEETNTNADDTQTTVNPINSTNAPMVLKQPDITTVTTKKSPVSTTAAMHIYKFSADEILRKFLEDSYIRSPLAALIDTSPECLRKSKRLWKAALRPNAAVDIVLVAYNSSGVGVTYSFKNTRTMEAGLDSVKESAGPESGGSAFYGIVRASELVPFDSAIFISTDSIPLDTNLAQYAAITLLKKRIRLYLIWFGAQTIDTNEASGLASEGGILGEVALRSGGEILRVTEEASGPNGDLGLITLFLSNDIQGGQELEIPIDTTMSNLQINLQGNVDTATLDTPIGGKKIINLLNEQEVATFSAGSFVEQAPSMDGSTILTIIWLNVSESTNGLYRLFVSNIQTNQIYTMEVKIGYKTNNSIIIPQIDYMEQKSYNWPLISRSNSLKNQNKFEELEEYAVNSNMVKFPEEDLEIMDSNEIITNSTVKKMERNILQALTTIEIGSQSQLLVIPGTTAQIYYEVTNLREVPTYHIFQVIDELRFLRNLNPQSVLLPPGQTVTVGVTAYIPPNTDVGTKDKITFSSQGVSLVSQAATLTITSSGTTTDRRKPDIWWNYGSRCFGKTDAGQCAGAVWSVEITAYDRESGILRVQSNPRGLIVRTPFTAGTTDDVIATYTSSCCTPKVTITAFDVAGNQHSISLDVTEFYLDAPSIAAITLGVLLLILILVIIIASIVWCCRRRESRDLPVYRTRSERERAT